MNEIRIENVFNGSLNIRDNNNIPDDKKLIKKDDYLKVKGIKASSADLKMSVLVQKMIDPLVAGVLFTLNPKNGFEEEFYLEFCEGFGERRVS